MPATLEKPSILSLFAGAGGLDLGFRQAGFRTLLAIDSDQAAIKTYNLNAKSKTAVSFNLMKNPAEAPLGELLSPDASQSIGVVGGPPCQGFSRGNAFANQSDPRNRLPFRFAGVVEQLTEKRSLDFFVFENVPGIKSSRHSHRFKLLIARFQKAGFRVFEKEIECSTFGLPQIRRRLFLVGINHRFGELADFSFPEGNGRACTVRQAIGHLPAPVFREFGLKRKDIPYHPNHWTMPPVSKRFRLQSFNEGRSFRKLEWDQPSRTVAYGNREIHIHPSGKRRLTVLEAMLLQGFPETYVLLGNFCEQVNQVCNAVPPPVALAIAKAVRRHLYED